MPGATRGRRGVGGRGGISAGASVSVFIKVIIHVGTGPGKYVHAPTGSSLAAKEVIPASHPFVFRVTGASVGIVRVCNLCCISVAGRGNVHSTVHNTVES